MPASHQTTADRRPRLGISACLTGLPVRYDGTDKRSDVILERIAPFVALYPLCPESAIGMPTPRPPIDLVQTSNGIIAQGKTDPNLNPTQSLQGLAQRTAEQPLDGFILTQRSPSCGLESTKVYQNGELIHSQGTGIFASELGRQRPDLLLVEEQALMCPRRCFAFLCGLYMHQRMPKDQAAAQHLQQELGYLVAGYSADAWQALEDLSQQSDVSGYRHHLQQVLKDWLAKPIAIALWLQQVQSHLQARYRRDTDRPLTLAELDSWLSRQAGSPSPAPKPLPFFEHWGHAAYEDSFENHDKVR